MNKEIERSYLGDGAYVKTRSYYGQFIIYTSDGLDESNHISLEVDAVNSLVRFTKKILEPKEE